MKARILTSFALLIFIFSLAVAQEQAKLYDPSLDGMKQVNEALAMAKSQNKHVFFQIGGNWCPWCIKFDAFCKGDADIVKLMNDNYITVKLNYSPENKNEEATRFIGGKPERFGYPVFVIVDGNGKRIHIQDSSLLEEGSGYSKGKVVSFFKGWTAEAVK